MFRRIDRVDTNDGQRHGRVVVNLHDRTENETKTIVAYLRIAQQLNGPGRIGRRANIIDTFPCSVDVHRLRHIS
jgi:hypothetical protein